LNRLFPDDKQITLEFVKVSILIWLLALIAFYFQKQYKNIAQVKKGLERTAPIDGKPKVPTKKVTK
jgi:hypothetical protein